MKKVKFCNIGKVILRNFIFEGSFGVHHIFENRNFNRFFIIIEQQACEISKKNVNILKIQIPGFEADCYRTFRFFLIFPNKAEYGTIHLCNVF